MNEDTRDGGRSVEDIRAHIVARLRFRSTEIEQAIYARVLGAVRDPIVGRDRAYQASMRETITAVVDYCLKSIELGSGWPESIPAAAAAQARLAARTGVSVGAVLRRYVVGHGELGQFVMQEAEVCGLSNHGSALHHIRRTQETLLEHLTASVEHEYDQERERMACSPRQRRAEIVQGILAGGADPGDLAELDYDIHTSWHVALVATGAGAGDVLDRLEAHFGPRVLLVLLDGAACAWLGGQQKLSETDIEQALIGQLRSSVGVGEAGFGLPGWCLTHRQAQAALVVALRKSKGLARYADDRLLAAALENDTLARSLKQRYLTALSRQRDGGATLRRTLRTYIDLDCNATSAAEMLDVRRRAVTSRVRTAERLIGSLLSECLAELDVALRLSELDSAQ